MPLSSRLKKILILAVKLLRHFNQTNSLSIFHYTEWTELYISSSEALFPVCEPFLYLISMHPQFNSSFKMSWYFRRDAYNILLHSCPTSTAFQRKILFVLPAITSLCGFCFQEHISQLQLGTRASDRRLFTCLMYLA